MALHPRLARPSLEPPPRRTSHALLAGLVLAVMGTGFALAMPIAMRTWTEAARRSETVARVDAAQPSPERAAEPMQVRAPGVEDALDRYSRKPGRPRATSAGPIERATGDAAPRDGGQPDRGSGAEPKPPASEPGANDDDGSGEPGPEPSPPEGKRDEEEEPEEAPDTGTDDDPDDRSRPSERATGRDEEEPGDEPDLKDEPEDEDDGSRSGRADGGGGSQGDTKKDGS